MSPSTRLTCLCGAISEAMQFELPASTELCHCNPCRQVTGSLFAGFAELPHTPSANTLAKCTTYHSSKTHRRLFCSTCGSKVLVHDLIHPDGRERDDWFAYAGCIERDPDAAPSETIRPSTHEWVADTVDGGLAPYMTLLGGRHVPAYRISQSDPPLSASDLSSLSKAANAPVNLPGPDERLPASCRCGAITLSIKPADHTDSSISKLDRFIPFDPATGEKQTRKYQARACACRSCRLAMGVSLTTYVYLPPPQVLNPHTGAALAYAHAAETAEGRAANRGLEALQHHWSSAEACRSFCGVCGSTVFYWNERRQEIVNVAAAMLQAEEGVLARRWVYWQLGMVSWKDESVDREILEAYLKADVN